MAKSLRILVFTTVMLAMVFGVTAQEATVGKTGTESLPITQGDLRAYDDEGKELLFPLKHTRVMTEISGFIARVMVTQIFQNPYDKNIEAIYVFPLPQNAAVEEMIMQVGDRVTVGEVHRREQARLIYELARQRGKLASLLEQERPNIFTQSVANIRPGDEVWITICYTEILIYDKGAYEFNFPMVVGPRYMPGAPTGQQGTGWAPDTTDVPDASRISPPVLKPGYRTGHDIDLEVVIDAGVPIQNLASKSHRIEVVEEYGSRATVRLAPEDTIPNKDFTLRYEVAGDKPQMALLTHASGIGGYFLLMVQPQVEPVGQDLIPREVVFVLDVSGSMSGLPIEKSKEVVKKALDGLAPDDTFRVITFSGSATVMTEEALANTPENIRRGKEFIDKQRGGGGTEMLKGVQAAMNAPLDPAYMRIIVFLTDGYIGNETQILGAIQENLGPSRVFSFGIGSSVNRYLIERMAEVGRGEAQFVRQDEDPDKAVERFVERIQKPCLMDIKLDWGTLEPLDIYPKQVPDLFAAQPVFLIGRYEKPGSDVVLMRGIVAGEPFEQQVEVVFPEWEGNNDSLASLWARMKIKDLMAQQYRGDKPEIVEEITNLALDYHLMSQYTSFVAVDDETEDLDLEAPITITQPVPIPEGVSFEGVFGNIDEVTRYGEYLGGKGLLQSRDGIKVESDMLSFGTEFVSRKAMYQPRALPPGSVKTTLPLATPAPVRRSSGIAMFKEIARVEESAALAYISPVDRDFFSHTGRGKDINGTLMAIDTWDADYRKLASTDKEKVQELQRYLADIGKTPPEEIRSAITNLLRGSEEYRQRIGLRLILSEAGEKVRKDPTITNQVGEISKKTTDWQTRALGIITLRELDTDKANKALELAAKDSQAEMRQLALHLAQAWQSPVAPAIFMLGTKDKDPVVRVLAASALSTGTLSNEGREALIRLIGDRDDAVSAAAIWSLAIVRKDQAAIVPCIRKLLSDDLTSFPLSLVQAGVSYRKLTKDMKSKGEIAPLDVWREVIKRTAMEQSTPKADAARQSLRLMALDALEESTDDSSFEAVSSCLSDESQSVRVKAISTMGRFGKRAIPIWLEVIKTGDQWQQPEVIEGAIRKLTAVVHDDQEKGLVAAEELVTYLQTLLKSSKMAEARYDIVRAAAIEALLFLNAAVPTTELERMAISDRSWRVRRAALLGLAKAEKVIALPVLIRALDDRSPAVRAVAVGAIALVTSKKEPDDKKWDDLLAAPTPVTMRKEMIALGFSETLLDARTSEVVMAFNQMIERAAKAKELSKDTEFQKKLASALDAAKQ